MMVFVFLGLAVIVAAVVVYGSCRWQAATKQVLTQLEAGRVAINPTLYESRELDGLPAPVQSYFRAALEDGQPMVSAVSVEQTGTFNMSETAANWKPFRSTQRVIAQHQGFVWDARIRVAPGLTTRVHDAYILGQGLLHATLFGLVSLVNLRGTPEVARGELMRFLAEAAWYPTALLPSQGVQWEAVDDTSAKATLKDGEATVTLLFRFNASGLIDSVRSEARERIVAGAIVPTPWEGRWSNYELRDGMRVPLQGEVAWILPEGPKPYWRGRITELRYEFASTTRTR